MLLQHRRAFASLIHAFDLTALVASIAVATQAGTGRLPALPQLGLEAAAATMAWVSLTHRTGLYESRRTAGVLGEAGLVLQGALLAIGLVLLVRATLGDPTPLHPGLAVGGAAAAMVGLRVAVRAALQSARRRGFNTRAVLFLGRGRTAQQIARDYQRHPSWGIQIVGQLSFNGEERALGIDGIPDLGSVAELQRILTVHAIDEVLLCPSDGVWATEVRSVLRFCQAVGLSSRVAPDFLGLPLERTTIAMTGDVPTWAVRSGFGDERGLGVKRLIDLLGSACALLALGPLLLLIAALIKLGDRGPILFAQERLGLNGRPFKLLKFRSMVPNAEQLKAKLAAQNEQQGPVFKMKRDPRITPIGRFLRKYSLDELPQLINVLLGDMSLVGPRPPLASEVVKYDWWQRRRLSVRPGLTCIWQVSGRNAISFDRWMELDMQYIDGWSLGMDLRIMAKTVKEVLRGGGA